MGGGEGSPNIAGEFCLTCCCPPPVVNDMSLIGGGGSIFMKTRKFFIDHSSFSGKGWTINHRRGRGGVGQNWEKKEVELTRRNKGNAPTSEKKKQVPYCGGKKSKLKISVQHPPQWLIVSPTYYDFRGFAANEPTVQYVKVGSKSKCLVAEEKKKTSALSARKKKVSEKSVPDTPPPND